MVDRCVDYCGGLSRLLRFRPANRLLPVVWQGSRRTVALLSALRPAVFQLRRKAAAWEGVKVRCSSPQSTRYTPRVPIASNPILSESLAHPPSATKSTRWKEPTPSSNQPKHLKP